MAAMPPVGTLDISPELKYLETVIIITYCSLVFLNCNDFSAHILWSFRLRNTALARYFQYHHLPVLIKGMDSEKKIMEN